MMNRLIGGPKEPSTMMLKTSISRIQKNEPILRNYKVHEVHIEAGGLANVLPFSIVYMLVVLMT